MERIQLINFIKKLYRRIKLYPFKEEDSKYQCTIFAFDSYTACFGCRIGYPDKDVVVWTQFPDKHPNVVQNKKLIYF